jgi:hypothetical protein
MKSGRHYHLNAPWISVSNLQLRVTSMQQERAAVVQSVYSIATGYGLGN